MEESDPELLEQNEIISLPYLVASVLTQKKYKLESLNQSASHTISWASSNHELVCTCGGAKSLERELGKN